MVPSISVIVPAYNSAASLPEAIASVRAQQWSELEIIVVDDGSTDETLQVLQKLADDDLRVLRQTNAGPAAARNRGIAAAQGEWVAFLDADDRWLPGKLAGQLAALQQHPNAGFSFTDVRFWYADGRTRDIIYDLEGRPLLSELLIGNVLATPTVIVRRDCLQQVGDFDVTMRTGEDWDMWLRLATRYDNVHLPDVAVLVCRTSDDTNLVKYPLKMLEHCTLRVIQRLFACRETIENWPQLNSQRRNIYAWQYSVLAKSYLQYRQIKDFCRLAARAVLSHPAAFGYLMRRGDRASDLARQRLGGVRKIV